METAIFAAGCFWGVEDGFRQLDGVCEAIVGYTGGTTDSPSYQQVCTGKTGHAEAVKVDYDPATISYEQLLNAFFSLHDPTQKNRQGWDIGSQYRSAIFVADKEQRHTVARTIDRWQPRYRRPIVTEVVSSSTFWPAEEYHQHYNQLHGHSCPRLEVAFTDTPVEIGLLQRLFQH